MHTKMLQTENYCSILDITCSSLQYVCANIYSIVRTVPAPYHYDVAEPHSEQNNPHYFLRRSADLSRGIDNANYKQ